jgi:hypothetical protein
MPEFADAAETGIVGAGASKGGAAGVGEVAVSVTGYDVSISAADALIFDAGAAFTALSGVPSTGQKLNLSANSSWQVSQNFIVTTSLSLWGIAEFDSGVGLLIAC